MFSLRLVPPPPPPTHTHSFRSVSHSLLSSASFPSSSSSSFFLSFFRFLPFLLHWLFLPYIHLPLVASSFRVGFSFLLRSFLVLFFFSASFFVFRLSFFFTMFSLAFRSSGFFLRLGVCFLSPLILSPFRLSSSTVCSSDSSIFFFRSPFTCHSLSRCSSLFFSSAFRRGCSFLFFASLFRGSPPLLTIAGIPPCLLASLSFGSLRVCFSSSVPDALRLLRLFTFSSRLLLYGWSSSFSTVAQLCFVLFCCPFFLVARMPGGLLHVKCLIPSPSWVFPLCWSPCFWVVYPVVFAYACRFLFGSSGFMFCSRGGGRIVHSSVRIPGVHSLFDCASRGFLLLLSPFGFVCFLRLLLASLCRDGFS